MRRSPSGQMVTSRAAQQHRPDQHDQCEQARQAPDEAEPVGAVRSELHADVVGSRAGVEATPAASRRPRPGSAICRPGQRSSRRSRSPASRRPHSLRRRVRLAWAGGRLSLPVLTPDGSASGRDRTSVSGRDPRCARTSMTLSPAPRNSARAPEIRVDAGLGADRGPAGQVGRGGDHLRAHQGAVDRDRGAVSGGHLVRRQEQAYGTPTSRSSPMPIVTLLAWASKPRLVASSASTTWMRSWSVSTGGGAPRRRPARPCGSRRAR